ncbi:MAG: PspC domain-containing protein [Bacteroidales bacterium]|nr:PspC domain-containing protein [Bacteroidales bacterium]
MKEVEKVSIGGYAFTLDKDAAAMAQDYLSSLEAHYLAQQGGKEIMEGIEERMAELLLEKCDTSGVASESDIRSIIDIIGRPEKIEEDDPEPEPAPEKPRRKLFRDLENKQLGGVCSGLATYFDAEVVWFRLGFVILTAISLFAGGTHGVWNLSVPALYGILWLAMPAARTAQERWAMKGDSGSLDDIKRNVQSGVREMGDTAGRMVKSDGFKNIGRIFLILIGLVLLITGTSGLASLSVLGLKGNILFGPQYLEFIDNLSEYAPAALNMLETPWVVALAALAVILPFVGMLYGGIQLIFGFKSPSWRPGLVIFILWLIDIIVLLVLGFATMVSTQMISV